MHVTCTSDFEQSLDGLRDLDGAARNVSFQGASIHLLDGTQQSGWCALDLQRWVSC